MVIRRLVPVSPVPPHVGHLCHAGYSAVTGNVYWHYSIGPMGVDPHGSNTVARSGRCRPCRLRGLGLPGTRGGWGIGWQAPLGTITVLNVDTPPIGAGENT